MNEVGQRILAGPPARPVASSAPRCPFELDAMVLRCLAPRPAPTATPSAAAVARETWRRATTRAVGTPLAIAAVVRGLFGAG